MATASPFRSRSLVAALLAAATLLGGPALPAAEGKRCPVTHRPDLPIMVGSAIRLEPGPGADAALVAAAIAQWEACPGYGESFPRFVTEGVADVVWEVRFESRSSGAARCGYLGRREIVLFSTVRTHDNRLLECRGQDAFLAHELGHVLGLADQGADRRCRVHVMAPIHLETLLKGTAGERGVQESECRAAGERWLTWSELEDGGVGLPGGVPEVASSRP